MINQTLDGQLPVVFPMPLGRAGLARDGVSTCLHRTLLTGLVIGPLLLQTYSICHVGRSIRLTDAYLYYAHARSWYFDGDADYANDYLEAPGFKNAAMYASVRTSTGAVLDHIPCGTSVISYGLIAIADGATALHNALATTDLPRNGYSAYYQIVVGFGHTLVGIAGLMAIYVLCARYFAPLIAAIAVSCVWLGTAAIYYVGYESTLSHTDSLAAVSVLLLLTDNVLRSGQSLGRMAGLGLAGGLMVVIRPQNVVWLIAPAVAIGPVILAGLCRGGHRARTAGLCLVASLVAVACYLPQAWVNVHLFGKPLVNTYEHLPVISQPIHLHWLRPDFLGPLVGPHRALLWTAPLAGLAIIGLAGLWTRRAKLLTATSLASAGMYYVCASVWWDPGGYGYRLSINCSAAFALGLCAVLAWASRRSGRWAFVGALVCASVLYQVHRFCDLALT